MTTKDTLSHWFDEGVKNKKEFMIVVCDCLDWEDYPVFCNEFDFRLAISTARENMSKVMEVYNLSMDKRQQLESMRVFNYPKSYVV